MSYEDVMSVSSDTGTFRRLSPQAGLASRASGKQETASGNNLPAAAKSKPDVEEMARKLNVASRSIGRDLRFEVNMDSGHSVIQVLDRETGEVIRQIPPEKAQLYLSASGGVNLRLIDEQI